MWSMVPTRPCIYIIIAMHFQAIVQYIPKQLYKRQNMDKIADQVAAGVSTYHIHNAKVVRHIVDNIEVDKDKVSHFFNLQS